jgi:YVTN family beta-propeller protein
MTGSNLVSVVNTNTKIEETTVLVGSVPTNIAVFIKPVKLNSVNQNPKLKEISLVVFPNPSSGIVTLKLDGVLTSNYSISIFDLQGRHIKN